MPGTVSVQEYSIEALVYTPPTGTVDVHEYSLDALVYKPATGSVSVQELSLEALVGPVGRKRNTFWLVMH